MPIFIVINLTYNYLEALAAYLRAIGEEQRQFLGFFIVHIFITIPSCYFLAFYF
jgi:hypothetical protein